MNNTISIYPKILGNLVAHLRLPKEVYADRLQQDIIAVVPNFANVFVVQESGINVGNQSIAGIREACNQRGIQIFCNYIKSGALLIACQEEDGYEPFFEHPNDKDRMIHNNLPLVPHRCDIPVYLYSSIRFEKNYSRRHGKAILNYYCSPYDRASKTKTFALTNLINAFLEDCARKFR